MMNRSGKVKYTRLISLPIRGAMPDIHLYKVEVKEITKVTP